MRSEPGHTWGGSTLSGQRLQEPALLGLPMYEAHRSWQLFGQCRAAIIMSAARNRIRHSPALLLAYAGPSLRLAVTAHFAAAFATQDAVAIPGLHCLCRDVPSVLRGVQHLADVGDVRQGGFTRCRLRGRFWAVFGAWHTSRPIFGRPWGGRRLLASCPQAEFARKYALHQGEEVGHDIAYGAALAACLQLVEYFLAMLWRQPPQGGLYVLC